MYNGRDAHLRTVAKSKYHYINYLGRDSFPISMIFKCVAYNNVYYTAGAHVHTNIYCNISYFNLRARRTLKN